MSIMGRFNRVVALDIPHHVTQRGNARRFILDCDADRAVYLKLLCENTKLYGVAVIGYCLMSNHIHLIATPTKADGLAEALKQTHGRYACYWNVAHQSSGHVWQGRYYSCPLDPTHLWEALRYAELNPLRASVVRHTDGRLSRDATKRPAIALPRTRVPHISLVFREMWGATVGRPFTTWTDTSRSAVVSHISRKTTEIWGTRLRNRPRFLTPLCDRGWIRHTTYTML